MKTRFIKPAAVRAVAKEHGKRVSKDFLLALDAYVGSKITKVCTVHNGGRKTIDGALIYHV